MNLLKWIAVTFAVALGIVCLILAFDLFSEGQTPNCNSPMWPCALHQTNAQLAVVPIPKPIMFSGLVGANQTWKATPYGTTMLRCTDVNTSTHSTTHNSYEVQDSGGANGQIWNADGTMLKILMADSGTTYVMNVDATGKRCSGMVPNSEAATGSVWDASNRDMDYTLTGMVISRRTGFSNPLGPTTSQLVDLSVACNFGTTAKMLWHSPLSTDGTNIAAAFSTSAAQDTGIYAVAYNLAKGGCQSLNTSTGTLTAKGYGSSGKVTGTNGFFPFTIHDMFLFGGGWATIGGSKCTGCPLIHGPYLWKIGSTTMNLVTVLGGGHETMGFTTYNNITNSPKTAGRSAATVNTTWFMSSSTGVNFPAPQETHCSWRNADWNETRPIWCSQVSQNEQQPIVIVTPLEQEIYGFDPKSGTYIRLAPTMTSGLANSFNFRSQNAIIAPAPKDALVPAVAWSSDAMGGLGNTDGVHPTCILGAVKPNECRSDVFIVFP